MGWEKGRGKEKVQFSSACQLNLKTNHPEGSQEGDGTPCPKLWQMSKKKKKGRDLVNM